MGQRTLPRVFVRFPGFPGDRGRWTAVWNGAAGERSGVQVMDERAPTAGRLVAGSTAGLGKL